MYDKFGALPGDVCLLRDTALLQMLLTPRGADAFFVVEPALLKKKSLLFFVIGVNREGEMSVLFETGTIAQFHLGAMILSEFFDSLALKLFQNHA